MPEALGQATARHRRGPRLLLWLVLFPMIACNVQDIDVREIEPFKSQKTILAEPTDECIYESVRAACNQIMLTLYHTDDTKPVIPSSVPGLEEVRDTVREHESIIVGQIPELVLLQVRTPGERQMFNLMRALRDMEYVREVQLNVALVFE